MTVLMLDAPPHEQCVAPHPASSHILLLLVLLLLALLCMQRTPCAHKEGALQRPTRSLVLPHQCDALASYAAPLHLGATHWGQQVFVLNPAIDAAPGDSLACDVKVRRQAANHRLLELDLSVRVKGSSGYATAEGAAPRDLTWHID